MKTSGESGYAFAAAAHIPNLPRLTLTSIIDIIIVAILIYQFIMIMRGRRAFPVLLGMLILGVIYLVASALRLELLRSILATALLTPDSP